MPILFCSLEIYIPYSHSLKDKRSVLRKTTARLRSRFNFSIAEIEYQDLWQRSRIGAVSIGYNRIELEKLSERFQRESERILGGDLVDFVTEILDYD